MQKDKQVDASIVLAALEEQARPILRALARIEINSTDDYRKASDKMKEVKQLQKLAADRQKSLVDPLNKVVADIKTLFKPFLTVITQAEERVKSDMLAFVALQEKKQRQIEQDLESGKIKKLSTAVRKQAEMEVSASSSQIRKVWTAVPVDVSKTPREYLVPNETKIREALKAGKKVAGWSWEQVSTIAI